MWVVAIILSQEALKNFKIIQRAGVNILCSRDQHPYLPNDLLFTVNLVFKKTLLYNCVPCRIMTCHNLHVDLPNQPWECQVEQIYEDSGRKSVSTFHELPVLDE